jgi:hypothetical protein
MTNSACRRLSRDLFRAEGSSLRPNLALELAATVHTAEMKTVHGDLHHLVGFNQDPSGDFGDWLSGTCPQATPFVQNAFSCADQAADVTGPSPEGINLDVIGYDLITAPTSTTTTTSAEVSVAAYADAPGGLAVGQLAECRSRRVQFRNSLLRSRIGSPRVPRVAHTGARDGS